MPDRRSQRSAAPEDAKDFAPQALPRLRTAVQHLSLLEGLGYTGAAPLELVGNRFQLTSRQRHAVRRCACSDERAAAREAKRVPFASLAGRQVWVDGFNLLITLETALGGGVVLEGRDGCLRDLAHLRGTWRRVLQTPGALERLGQTLARARVASAHVLVDARVSNSGRLVTLLRKAAAGWPVKVTCEASQGVDRRLAESAHTVATADSIILDACDSWTNLVRPALDLDGVPVWRVNLASDALQGVTPARPPGT